VGATKNQVEKYLPELFQPHLLCAGYPASSRGSCQGDSGGPLMTHNETNGQYFQVGMVSGGVSFCGNTDIPDYYVRLDHPEIAGFVSDPENYKFGSFPQSKINRPR
jgi:secreted trypsin-like serine protease